MKNWFDEQIVGPVREMSKDFGNERSPLWRKTRKNFLAYNNKCAVCGTKKGLNVHHIKPFHLRPELELEASNLITLCRKDHFIFGHLGYWKSWNDFVEVDCEHWRLRYKNRPTKIS